MGMIVFIIIAILVIGIVQITMFRGNKLYQLITILVMLGLFALLIMYKNNILKIT